MRSVLCVVIASAVLQSATAFLPSSPAHLSGLRFGLRASKPLRGGTMSEPSAASATSPATVCDGTAKFTGVRFSLYPKGEHIKQTIKTAMSGVGDLGVKVLPDDATFSAGCPGETELIEVERTITTDLQSNEDGWIEDAFSVNGMRVAAQFSLYPLGSSRHMEIIYQEIARAKESPAWKPGKTHFCSMLDGDGDEVFRVLRNCFENAQKECGHVVMTATLTANKRAWLEAK